MFAKVIKLHGKSLSGVLVAHCLSERSRSDEESSTWSRCREYKIEDPSDYLRMTYLSYKKARPPEFLAEQRGSSVGVDDRRG